MKRGTGVVIGVVLAALLAGAGGYWLGSRHGGSGAAAPANATAMPERAAAGGQAGETPRKLLYYRNPMGLPDTSPTPKKDPMGMDYIPVYEDEAGSSPDTAGQVRISPDKVQKLGVRTAAAQRQTLERIVRAAGRVEPDERRVYTISPKFEGYVERLFVNVTGQPVGRGQALFEVYSPELVSAQREYAIAAQGMDTLKGADERTQAGMKQLADSSLMRLRNWDVPDDQIRALARTGEARRTITFRSPVAGIVTEKKALQGMRFMPGEALYQVADLSSVWVVADVFEQDIGLVKSGASAKLRINAYPDKLFDGKVSYIYPTLNAATRTIPVRVELANPGLLLKPAMFAQMELPVTARAAAITVPVSAVIDSGTRQLVLVQLGEGRFEPREVKLGVRSDALVEVLDGVREGEQVVVSANFLIDAESNLKAAVGGFGHAAHGAAPATGTEGGPGQAAAQGSGHQAEGTVESIDAKAGTLSVEHGPIASLNWPAMTMEFKVANASLLQGIDPGARVVFEFVERAPGEWVVTSLQAKARAGAARPAAPPAANAHAGH